MATFKEILISPMDLKRSSQIDEKIIMKKSREVLLVGKLVDDCNSPVVKAIISIKQIDNSCYPPQIRNYGYLITNQNGEYAVMLPCSREIDYMLDAYQPMVRC